MTTHADSLCQACEGEGSYLARGELQRCSSCYGSGLKEEAAQAVAILLKRCTALACIAAEEGTPGLASRLTAIERASSAIALPRGVQPRVVTFPPSPDHPYMIDPGKGILLLVADEATAAGLYAALQVRP